LKKEKNICGGWIKRLWNRKRIRIQDERRLFLLQPNIIIPKWLKKYKCEKR
jgi:hypothetical protein